jgi:hypothetical protein
MNASLKLLPISLIYTAIFVFFVNWYLIDYYNIASVGYNIYYALFIILFFFIYGMMVSITASREQCSKISMKDSLYQGLKLSFYVLITFGIISYFPSLLSPFRELIGVNEIIHLVRNGVDSTVVLNLKADRIAQIYFIGLSLIIGSISAYGTSAKEICQLSIGEIKENVSELEKYLNEPYKEDNNANVIVKD